MFSAQWPGKLQASPREKFGGGHKMSPPTMFLAFLSTLPHPTQHLKCFLVLCYYINCLYNPYVCVQARWPWCVCRRGGRGVCTHTVCRRGGRGVWVQARWPRCVCVQARWPRCVCRRGGRGVCVCRRGGRGVCVCRWGGRGVCVQARGPRPFRTQTAGVRQQTVRVTGLMNPDGWSTAQGARSKNSRVSNGIYTRRERGTGLCVCADHRPEECAYLRVCVCMHARTHSPALSHINGQSITLQHKWPECCWGGMMGQRQGASAPQIPPPHYRWIKSTNNREYTHLSPGPLNKHSSPFRSEMHMLWQPSCKLGGAVWYLSRTTSLTKEKFTFATSYRKRSHLRPGPLNRVAFPFRRAIPSALTTLLSARGRCAIIHTYQPAGAPLYNSTLTGNQSADQCIRRGGGVPRLNPPPSALLGAWRRTPPCDQRGDEGREGGREGETHRGTF